MIGTRFTKLTVISNVKGSKWLCRCDCGTEVQVMACLLKNGNNKSCGCLKRDVVIARNKTHGMSDRSEYNNWKDMLKRCFNPKNKRYEDYAGRGISVHKDFIKDFPLWLAEIGDKPDDGQRWSVGRIDNDGWYTYGNMRWELDNQQARNHTKQSNNTSGITGVKFETKVIAGTTYTSWVACWKDLNGKSKTKNFSTNKFGVAKSKQMAIDHRNKMIEELNRLGAEYAESHGSDK